MKLKLPMWIATTAAITAAAAPALAQEPPRWSIGGIGFAYRSAYEEDRTAHGKEKLNYNAFPYVAYRGDRFFIDGLEAGLHVAGFAPSENSGVMLDLLANLRTLPGFSRNKISGDAGARVSYESALGSLSLTALHDITDTGNGTEIRAAYGYTMSLGAFALTPSAGAVWQDRRMANYMWGVSQRAHERMVARGRTVLPAYELTESVVNYEGTLLATYTFGNSWTLLAYGSSTLLDKAIRRHPGVDKDFDVTVGSGLAYSF